MNNFLRAHLRHSQNNSITLLKRPYTTVVCGLMLIASMLLPTGASAQFFGFSGGTATVTPLVCSGGTATVTFTGAECSIGAGPDWSANFQVEVSTDGGSVFNPAPGTSSGVISHAANSITYVSPVLTTAVCTTVIYRIQLTSVISHCIPSNTAYTSPNATVNLCPTPAPITGPSAVCVGSTITVATTSTGGTWTSSATTVATVNATTGDVGGISATPVNTATISYTISGCSATKQITVNPTPVITGSSVICQGTTATYTLATPIVGTWSSTNAAVGTIDAATGVYTASATSTGTTTISYTTVDGCGGAFSATVNPIPDTIGCFGSGTMCFGDTITLCNASAGGTWSSGNPGVITVINPSSGAVTPTALGSFGTATISYTLLGCSATKVLTVSPGPTSLTGPSTMCEGETIVLVGSPVGGIYTDPASPANFAVNPVTGAVVALNGSGGGVHLVNYSLGSCTISKAITVNITPTAIVGGPALCVGQTVTFTSTPAGGLWTMSTTASPSPLTPIGVFSGVTTAVNVGTANISYTLPSSGCRAITTVTVGVAPAAITGPTTVCQNSSITLCNTTFGGDWGTLGGTGTGTVNPTFASCTDFTGVTPGTVIVTYNLGASGCFSSHTVNVTPAPTAIVGPDYICSGLTANYSTSPGLGVWTIIPGTGTATVTPATGVVTGGPIGTVTIRYTLPNTCNVSRVVTVATTPTPITGVLAICVGQATNLTSSPLGGTWYGTDTSVAFVDTLTGLVTGRSPGGVIVHYVLQPQGCEAIAVVTVNPLPPAIGGPSGVCLGDCVTLTNSLPGGTWSSSLPSRGSIANPSVGTVCGVGVGTTNISYTDPSTGCAITKVFTVHALPLDITGVFQVCVGSTTTLSNASPPGGGTWTSSNTLIAPVNPTTGVVTGLAAGTANITYTLPTGCDTFVTVTVNPLPAAITGGLHTCVGSCRTLSSASPGGTWSTTFPAIATVNPSTGLLCGVSVGTTFITYTLPTGCITVGVVTVEPTPPNPTGITSICVGGVTTWSHAEPGGTWSSSDTNIAKVFVGTGTITGIAAGTANITYTTAIGCATFTTITVNPVPPASTGIQYLCVNNTTTLSNSLPGGSWWSANVAVATVGSNDGVVTGISGLDTVTIFYVMPSGCAAATTVTVYPIPVITGAVLVCPGVASTLSATPTGGLWTSSPTSVATIGSLSGVVMGVTPGTVNVTYILASTCMAHITATVQPLPAVITGPTQVCEGSTIQLFNATGGGGTWSSGNPAVGTVGATTGIVYGVSAGTVAITFTANTTGCVISTIITVNPLPGAIGGPPFVCVGSTITLASSPAGGTWSATGGHTTVNPTTGDVTGISAGVDDITYTLATGCFITRGVTVNPLPDPITSTSALHVCHGNTITVYSGPAGGIWSTGATNITLTPLATGSDTATVVGISPGTAVITYALPTGCFDTGVIIVDPLPGPIGGLMNLCVNDTTTLTNPVPGGTWSSENIFIAVIDPSTGLLATVSAGTVLITYTLPTGCFITGMVTINPIPQPITGPLAICVNDIVTLSNVTTGGTWVSSNTSVATIGSASGITTGISGYGTTTITYTLPSSCYRTAELTVNPLPSPITGTFAICRGDTTVFASAPGGGTWSSSHPDTAFIFMPTGELIGILAGTATITYTLPTGCMRTAGVTINPIPPASGIGGPRVLCQGQTGTLIRPIGFVGGTWSAAPTTVATINATTGLWGAVGVVGGVATTATIVYTSANGCDTFITVTVNPLPAAITGVLSVCVNSTTTLSSTTAGGSWSGGLPAVGTIDPTTGVFTGIGAGATIVTYTLPGTGCFVTATVTVNPLPGTITGNNDMCLGDIDTLTTPSTGGSWSFSPSGKINLVTFGAGFNNASITALDTGIVTITYTLPTGCLTTVTVNINPLPMPIVGPDTVCLGSTVTLTSTPAVGGALTWTSLPAGVVGIASGSAANDTVLVTGLVVDTATITVTNSHGCIQTFDIIVRPLPTSIFGATSVCVGFTATAIDTTLGGTWSVSDTTLLTTVATIDPVTGVFTGVTPGTAVITYTLPTSCYVTRIITVNPIPEVVIDTYPSIICRNSSTTLTASGAGVGGTYSWSPSTGLTPTTGPTVTASPTITTTYTVTGTTAAGCSDTAIVTVWVDSLLNDITIIGQDSICLGDCTTLIAQGRESTYFEWKPAVGLSCTVCDTVTACPTTTTVYNALAIDSLGCRDSLFFTVTVMPLPVLSVNPNPIIVCNGRTATATVIDLAGGPGTRFAWFPNAFISDDTASTVTFSNTSNLVYRITGITPFGCYDSIKVPVTVLDSAFNSINKDTVICVGGSAQLYVKSFNPDGARSDFYWLNGIPESLRFIPNPVVSPTITTTYTVAVTPNVCFPDTLYTTVVVVERPDFTLSASPSGNVAPGTSVDLTATFNTQLVLSSYAWGAANTVSCIECFRTTTTPSVTTTYTFTATSVYGCSDTKTITINVGCENSQVFIANSFTPNGDGMNDRFFVQGKGISRVNKFLIFSRWGELVFEKYNIDANDPGAGWDGQFKDVMLPPGVYYYVVEATCNLGSVYEYKGDVTIVK